MSIDSSIFSAKQEIFVDSMRIKKNMIRQFKKKKTHLADASYKSLNWSAGYD